MVPLLGQGLAVLALAASSQAQGTPAAPGIPSNPRGPQSPLPSGAAAGGGATTATPNSATGNPTSVPGGAGTPGAPGVPANPTGPGSPTPPDATAGTAPGTAPITGGSEVEQLRALILAQQQQTAQLLTRLQALEAGRVAAPTTPAPAPVVQSPTVRFPLAISGIVLERLDLFGDQDGSGPQLFNTFRNRRVQFGFNATITPRVSGLVLINFGKINTTNNAAATAGSATTLALQAAPLQTASISYRLSSLKAGAPGLFADVGAFKIPLGYEGDIPDALPQFAERSLIFRTRDRFGGGTAEISDTGAQLRGTLKGGKIDARLGLFNGLGERGNLLASADPKAVVGRLVYRFDPTGNGLQLGVSAAHANDQNVLVSTTTNGVTTTSPIGQGRRSLYNAFAVYKKNKLAASAEVLFGRSGLSGLSTTANEAIRVRPVLGYYVGGGYLITPKFELTARYDTFDFDRDFAPAAGASGDVTVTELTAGFNYYIKGTNARIQTNYVRSLGGSGLVAFASAPNINFRNTRNELRTQFQLAF